MILCIHSDLLCRKNTVKNGTQFFVIDGLNSIKYHINEYEQKNTYTRILIHLNAEEVDKEFFSINTQVRKLEAFFVQIMIFLKYFILAGNSFRES